MEIKKKILQIPFTCAIIILMGCADDPVACFTYDLSDAGKVTLNSTCSENTKEYRWTLKQEQLSNTTSQPSESEKANPSFDFILPGEHTVSLVAVNHYKEDSTAQVINAPEYCVICEDYSQCAGFFKAEAEARAQFLNERDFEGCIVELKQ